MDAKDHHQRVRGGKGGQRARGRGSTTVDTISRAASATTWRTCGSRVELAQMPLPARFQTFLPIACAAVLANVAIAQELTTTSTSYADAQCTTRDTECGLDDVSAASRHAHHIRP
eukprot:SAG31_NODE_14065_length_829_cov_1.030137_1_plen_114_part_01